MRANDRNRARIVVALLFMFVVINFADKAVVGIAAVPIKQELELGPRQFGGRGAILVPTSTLVVRRTATDRVVTKANPVFKMKRA
jgi:hypothetical protein